MAKQTSKNITIWLATNKNGFVGMHTSQPKRNITTGKWESKSLYLNSLLYKEMIDLANKAELTWEKEAEPLEINFN